ncbi:putative dual-specificity RNA methyltransferase RlmN [Mycobacterium talmoniae]|uniref:Putative dual-specificity RNA methyltransferase RlmN n=1 Tax=Mycobacterium talmoniae TaxID=1858794 RepID=A0A2S8BFJ7_9MYCO|nr:putative dual-specificity RNA methyltransferase RlmN [Mycobacterium talmoniae]
MKQQLVFEAPRRALPPRHLADLDATGRAAAVSELGLPAFRAKQLAHQYYGRLIADPQQMTDLPAAVRASVADALFPTLLTATREIECDAGQTRKMVWRAVDGTSFESVVMRYPRRNTVCISSQAGCGMACPFCATGQGGLTRNLSTAEIVEQVRAAAVELRDRDHGRLSNIVFMGMGEPLANYNRVLAAVRRITEPTGFGISARAVTVSTVGLAPAIRKLADERLGVTLALSLHAPDDELRDTLVPVNNRWKIAEALDAARYYAEATGRRVSVEYALIRDVNDQPGGPISWASGCTARSGRWCTST